MRHFDCIVAGAGVSGFAAALGAARAGARVLLTDKLPCAGGTAVYTLTPILSGWGEGRRGGGVADELAALLEKRGGMVWRGGVAADEYALQRTMLDMLEDSGVETLFNAQIVGAERDGGRIRSLEAFCLGKMFRFSADCFVDATGDASLAMLAGAETATPPAKLSMTKTLMFKMGHVKEFDTTSIKERFARKTFPVAIQDQFMGRRLTREDEMILNLTAAAGDAGDPLTYNRLHDELLRQIPVVAAWLQKEFPEFADARVIKVAPVMGVRYTRSIVGRRCLTMRDMRNPEPPPEPVALCGGYIGGHYVDGFASPWGSGIPGNPAIPYGALRSRNCDNLLAAGRIIAAEPEVVSAVRLCVQCMASGQAAGIAAALKLPEYDRLVPELRRQNCRFEKTILHDEKIVL